MLQRVSKEMDSLQVFQMSIKDIAPGGKGRTGVKSEGNIHPKGAGMSIGKTYGGCLK